MIYKGRRVRFRRVREPHYSWPFLEAVSPMLSYRKCALAFGFALFLIWFANVTAQVSGYKDPRQKRVADQVRENHKWEYEAKRQEATLVNEANEYYKRKEFDKAEKYYRKAVDLRYWQWDLTETTVGGVTALEPARRKKKRKLRTSYTRIAEDRLRTMPEKRQEQRIADANAEFKELFEDADIERQLGNLAEAYKIYDKIIKEADKLGKEKVAIENALKAKKAQEDLLKPALKLLADAENFVKKKKPAEAVKSIEEFNSKYGWVTKLDPALKKCLDELCAVPEVRRELREQEAKLKIALGDAAVARQDYLCAVRHYESVIRTYADTTAGPIAAEKLAAMKNDPMIAEAMKQQEMELACKPLLARSGAMLKMGEFVEAKAACEKIIADYPDSAWAKQAAELLKEINDAEKRARELIKEMSDAENPD